MSKNNNQEAFEKLLEGKSYGHESSDAKTAKERLVEANKKREEKKAAKKAQRREKIAASGTKASRVRLYIHDNFRSLLRILIVTVFFIIVFKNGDVLEGVDLRMFLEDASTPLKSLLIVSLIYFVKGLTMIVPAAIVNIAVGMSFSPLHALILNFLGTIIELMISYAVGIFAGGDYIYDNLNSTKYGSKFLNMKQEYANRTMFVVRLLPFVPIDFASLFYGNIHFSFWKYLLISFAGICPRTILFTLLGNEAYKFFPQLTAKQLFIILAFFMLGYVIFSTVMDVKRSKKKRLEEEAGENGGAQLALADGEPVEASKDAKEDTSASVYDSSKETPPEKAEKEKKEPEKEEPKEPEKTQEPAEKENK